MLEGKSFWSAVTCHRFGPWRPAAMLPPGSTCARVSLSTWQRCDRSQRTKAPTGRTHSKEVRGIQHEINIATLLLSIMILGQAFGGVSARAQRRHDHDQTRDQKRGFVDRVSFSSLLGRLNELGGTK